MNKEKVLQLAKKCGFYIDEQYIAGSELDDSYDLSDKLLAFANACEKIGMEKAAKICEPSNINNQSDWTEYARIKAECAEEIRNHYEPSMADFRCTEPD